MKKRFSTSLASLALVSTVFLSTVTQAEDPAIPDDQAQAQPADATPVVPEAPKVAPALQKMIDLFPNMIARIEPTGTVCVQGEPCDVSVPAVASASGGASGEPRDGEAVYNAVCKTCHASGTLNAPIYGDAGAWSGRVSQGQDTLYDHAINGFNSMPAKGGADIPDEEVKNAVDYMVDAVS